MSRCCEILKRDGPARLGRLLLNRPLDTPGILSPEDWVSAGSVFQYPSLQEAREAAMGCQDEGKLFIQPYIPSALHAEIPLQPPLVEVGGPSGLVVHPFSDRKPEDADVYIVGNAGSLSRPRDLVEALAGLRERIPPDAALFAPALATPWNLALLVYLGVDLVDDVRVAMDGYYGKYHTRDGALPWKEFQEIPCRCRFCRRLQEIGTDESQEIERGEGQDAGREVPELLAGHNRQKLEEEVARVRELIRREGMREYLERQVRVTPDLTATLRVLDQEHVYLERRTPTVRRSTLYATTAESLQRVEVTRFAQRALERYQPPHSDVLLLLPCSARKPYSTSRSHRLFALAVGGYRRHLNELILTSPLALVPRELEEIYPASSYDVPVTGRWDLEERDWLLRCLDRYLANSPCGTIVAHLEGELRSAVEEHGIDATFTAGGTSEQGLASLASAVSEACQGASRLGDFRLRQYRALADYFFGRGAGDALLEGTVRLKGREVQDEDRRPLASITPNGTLALSLVGARRLEPLGRYLVTIGDFEPRGTILAPGVVDADAEIRPGDEVIVVGSRAFGVGRARMSGWEMVQSRRGVAVDLRHVKRESDRR
ncbi:MAG: pseudouridine synthase [Methanosarcinales archaeon]|nr:pseudouridine synthase [Methanosarcinales archaeon]